ncbi:MAG: bifunctional [glutamate--ammonia ligase]-adenylyl-L-tyrosine phosphorylase/[glutamate--ammonia-ligase] adenylyltransferase [Gallionella sp.]|nr:bifunctional [glutamate--ammonia ligase]-adenylyl-L-tyrosine phosphorylase/[glutamate--ammonia-ligase] adenylyltransferase [Gallionella sp.]MDD4960476.1 bifunctional [glutamate--ammonia ligase]-adenylyl-L-tyrosine phosphorylase/[glutamate--ammonia-ligase] adenylyltransferase [Gallionella sp.]
MNTQTTAFVDFLPLLTKTKQCSRYAKRILEADAALLGWLEAHYHTPCDRAEMLMLLNGFGLDLNDESALEKAVRKLRQHVMVKLILRDLNGLGDLDEVIQAMTALAEICVQHAQSCLMRLLQAQFGEPIGEQTQTPQSLLIIGMGKLGGGELNVSSDIDLIFIYPEDGTTNGARQIDNHDFFTRLGRRLIRLIHEVTGDGYVFRVDMRLRPYGDSGPLVMSFAALEQYLISQGREWERYAWIKARVISPVDHPATRELMKLTQPFVFRKYMDFGAIDSMRSLHSQIRQEVQRRDRSNNIKLGPGGIREIEFTAQVFQLIRGGSDARLRIYPTRSVLQVLVADGQLSAETVTQLITAYNFLRNLEHRLQYLDDQQTQDIPDSADDQARLALGMGYADYAGLLTQLDTHRIVVSAQFEQIFGAQEAVAVDVWHEDIDETELHAVLTKLHYHAVTDTTSHLLQLRHGTRYRQLPEPSRQRVNKLLPQFITLSAQQAEPDATLARMLTLLEAISRRASYLAFLSEYPQALLRLVTLVAASSWAAEYLTQHPALFDELLDAREMYLPPDWVVLDSEMGSRLAQHHDDLERQMDVLRHIQQEQIFHLLAMDLQGLLPLETLSDHLSDLADLILRHALRLCWTHARKRHCDEPRFAIIAYGKLGGRELGYASDLDLIFLFDDEHPDAQENYARLAQRINVLLSSYTTAGRLYETDLRLRPNGESGLLVSTVAAFADYQQHHAWVWEHQALTRARFSAGNAQVGAAFEAIRRQVLCQSRELSTLRAEIVAMRQKMHEGHPNTSGKFDIKHDHGGMVDIEFIVQYLVLAYAHSYPKLADDIGNLALLKLAGQLDLISADLAESTRDLYRTLRKTQHRLRLNHDGHCRITHGEINTEAAIKLWERLLMGA